MKMSGLFLSAMAVLLAPAAPADPVFTDLLTRQAASSCGSGTAQSLIVPAERKAEPILLFSLPGESVAAGAQVTTEVRVGGELYLSESFVHQAEGVLAQARRDDGSVLVFELFDTESAERGQLLALQPEAEASITIAVDGQVLRQLSLAEFLAESDQVKNLGVLPRAIDSRVERLAELPQVYSIQPKFHICGDNICSQEGFQPETCLSCPEDCSEMCYCGDGICNGWESCSNCQSDCGSCCPTNLPNQQYYDLLGANPIGTQCFQDIFYPYAGTLYWEYQFYYKITTVSRVRECNGSITETPISVTYTYTYCYQGSGLPCSWGFPYYPSCTF